MTNINDMSRTSPRAPGFFGFCDNMAQRPDGFAGECDLTLLVDETVLSDWAMKKWAPGCLGDLLGHEILPKYIGIVISHESNKDSGFLLTNQDSMESIRDPGVF